MKVAIVHDWLVGGGAELVVEQLHKMYPDAPIYTSYCTDEWRKRLDSKVVTGVLQHWPFSVLRKYLPLLRIWWFGKLDLSDYDLVISSSGNGEAKSVKTPDTTTHVCYCHSPTHFYWRHYGQYVKYPGFGPFASFGLRMLVKPLRRWDKKVAQRPDFFIANSTHIQNDIKKYYGRDSVIIHPPVDTERFAKAKSKKREGFITVGRQVPYKKVGLIVQACSELGLPLTVIGRGPDHANLARQAGPTVTFITDASNQDVEEHMASAEAFIIAAFEDFGITPVEAMAAGTPVMAYKAGGALDYVIPGKTGEFFEHQTPASLKQVLLEFEGKKYNSDEIKKYAKQFNEEAFRDHFKKFILEHVK
jgi:glycosyltransferase involved in cell wall biosynthesis